MPLIEELIPFTFQPQYPVEVDRSNPFAKGLAGAVTRFSGAVGTPPLVTTTSGIAHNGNNASYFVVNSEVTFASAATILYVGNFTRTESVNLFVGIGHTTAGNQLFSFQNDTSGAPRAVIRAVDAGGITSAESSSLGATGSSTNIDVWAAVYDGTSALKLYRNGVNDTSGNANIAATGATSSYSRISLGGIDRGTDSFAQSGQYSLLTLAWNRALTATEILAISNNPWQIFSPIQRSIFVAAAGGAVIGTTVGRIGLIGSAAGQKITAAQTVGAIRASGAAVAAKLATGSATGQLRPGASVVASKLATGSTTGQLRPGASAVASKIIPASTVGLIALRGLVIGGPPAAAVAPSAERTLIIAAEIRQLTIAAENRTLSI